MPSLYTVRFWVHDPGAHFRPVNDCFGNTLTRTVTASTTREAVGKVQRRVSLNIKIHSVTR